MSNQEWVMVPVEPTPEMLDAAVQDGICVDGKPVWKRDVVFQAKWKYQQMLAAAPAVHGEPVGYVSQDFLEGKWSLDHIAKSDEGQISRTIPVFTKPPQPTEQQPIRSDLARDAANHLTNWLEMDVCECEGGHYCGYNEVKRTRDALLEAAEQQPAPAVQGEEP